MTAPTPDATALVADIGATNARFALIGDGPPSDIGVLRCAEHPSLTRAIRAYLEEIGRPMPARAAIAVASPVTGDTVTLTNHAWTFSIAEMKAELDLERLEVVNDFSAQALAVPRLTPADMRQIGGGEARPGQAIGVIGPGTGLGVSGLVPTADRWVALAAEGGHVTLPATNEREEAVIRRLRLRFSHVSAERTLSGMGLANLYETLAAIDGEDIRAMEPREVTEAAIAGHDPHAVEAVNLFCGMLGTVAGNLALTLGAFGGVYIAGGIVPKLGDLFDHSPFRERFVDKGRFRGYLDGIVTRVVTHRYPAFLGLKAVLDREGAASVAG
jgi:glucokinase